MEYVALFIACAVGGAFIPIRYIVVALLVIVLLEAGLQGVM